jgi:hypothetical protein
MYHERGDDMLTISRLNAETNSPEGADIFAIWLMLKVIGGHGRAFRRLGSGLSTVFARRTEEPVVHLQKTFSEEAWHSAHAMIIADEFDPLSSPAGAKELLACMVREAVIFGDNSCLTRLDLWQCPLWRDKDIDSPARELEEAEWI